MINYEYGQIDFNSLASLEKHRPIVCTEIKHTNYATSRILLATIDMRMTQLQAQQSEICMREYGGIVPEVTMVHPDMGRHVNNINRANHNAFRLFEQLFPEENLEPRYS